MSTAPIISVYDGSRCLGHIRERDREHMLSWPPRIEVRHGRSSRCPRQPLAWTAPPVGALLAPGRLFCFAAAGAPVAIWPATTACPPSFTLTCWTMNFLATASRSFKPTHPP
jgi:hypothetical protein